MWLLIGEVVVGLTIATLGLCAGALATCALLGMRW